MPGAGQPGEQAIGWCIQIKRDIEFIFFRYSVQPERKLVSASNTGRDQGLHFPVQDGARVGDFHIGRDADQMPFPGYGLGNIQFTNFQFSDIDIEIRQQRTFGWQQFRHAQQLCLGHNQRADINMAADKRKRAPVHCDGLGGGEHAFGIADFQIDNFHLAVEGAINFADFQLHTAFKFKRFNLLLDKAMTAAAVQPQIAGDQQDEDQRDQCAQAGGKFFAQTHASVWLGRGFGFHHQNACPIDIYTDIRDSPGWRLIGVATSSLRGPKFV